MFIIETDEPDLMFLELSVVWLAPPGSRGSQDCEELPLDYKCVGASAHAVGYIPSKAGQHQISVKWKGRAVTGSPFLVSVHEAGGPNP